MLFNLRSGRTIFFFFKYLLKNQKGLDLRDKVFIVLITNLGNSNFQQIQYNKFNFGII